jgi:uncharacterized pyridoxamine 5'-phosphate oxidase family protein
MTLVFFPQDSKYQELLQKVIPIHFSCITSAGWPIVLSLWYIEKGGKIYCATKKDAKVIQYLKENPKCAFEISPDKPPYMGLRGRGHVTLREDIASEILESLIDRYLGNRNSKLAKLLLSQSSEELAIEITPAKLFSWDYTKRMKNSS